MTITYFKGLVDQHGRGGFKMKEVSADKGYLGAENMLDHVAARRDPLHSVQVKLSSAFSRQLWRRSQNCGRACFTSTAASRGVSTALSQAI